MKQYLELLKDIKENGEWKDAAREEMPKTKSIFSRELRFDLQEGFPAVTTKKLFWKGVVGELLWFLRGDINIKYLVDNNIGIWNDDALKYYNKVNNLNLTKEYFLNNLDNWNVGDCGNIYGKQWRDFHIDSSYYIGNERNQDFDQISYVINNIKTNPNSRYHVVTAWNPIDFLRFPDSAALPACHMLFQFYVRQGKYLDLKMVQRSCDTFLGVPLNIASYALLNNIVADLVGLEPGEFIWSGNDIHYYENHQEQVDEVLTRIPKKLPKLKTSLRYNDAVIDYSNHNDFDIFINSFDIEDFELENYEYYPIIKAPLSVGK